MHLRPATGPGDMYYIYIYIYIYICFWFDEYHVNGSIVPLVVLCHQYSGNVWPRYGKPPTLAAKGFDVVVLIQTFMQYFKTYFRLRHATCEIATRRKTACKKHNGLQHDFNTFATRPRKPPQHDFNTFATRNREPCNTPCG